MSIVKECGGYQVAEPLEKFLHLLLLKRPTLDFYASKKSDDLITTVGVVEEGYKLGLIKYRKSGGRYDSRLGYSPSTIEIHSRAIDKVRGERGVTASSNPTTSLKNALKYFKIPSVTELAEILYDAGKSAIYDSKYHTKYEMSSVVSYSTREMSQFMAEWALQSMGGKDVPKLFPKDKVRINYDKLEACLNERTAHANIDASINMGNGYFLTMLKDDRLALCRLKDRDYKVYNTFDALPTEVQGNFAVLKMVPRYEAVENIGMNLGDNIYYVITSEM